MKTLCVLIPRTTVTTADAIAATSWGLTTASLWENMLDELHESMNDLFSFEVFLLNQSIYLCFTAAGATLDIIAGAVYTVVPGAELEIVPDITFDLNEDDEIASTDVRLVRDGIYPIGSYKPMKANSMAQLVAALSGLHAKDRVIVQFVAQPAKDTARLHSDLFGRRAGDRLRHIFRTKYWFKKGLAETINTAISEKLYMKLYRINLRIAGIRSGGKNEPDGAVAARRSVQTAFNALTFVNTLDLNALKMGSVKTGPSVMRPFQDRYMGKPFLLSSQEFATLYHVPSLAVLPNTARVLATKMPAPGVVPADEGSPDICWFGATDYREQRVPFGVLRRDRIGHQYVIGNPGTGKSCLLQLLTRADMRQGHGFAVVDPHGDLIDDILKLVPEDRVEDVVIFDPSDKDFPISFNPLEQVPDALKIRVAIGFIEMFKKLFEHTWSERLEHLLRYTVLALLSTRGTTMLSIRRMLTNPQYRKMIAQNVSDYTVRKFWLHEFDDWASRYEDEAITPLLDRVGQFLSNTSVRNIVCQPVNRLRLRELMDQGKILLVKLPSGLLGEENSSLLGGMMIAKIYQAAMSRADTPREERVPFYLYVDEFQNFATNAFEEILSESRKYGLSLTLAHQYLDQLPASVRQAIFGNVTNILSFRVGGADAAFLAGEFQPRTSEDDLANLGMRDFYVKMSVNDRVYEPFSGRTLDVMYPDRNFAETCRETSRMKYAVAKEHAQNILQSWEGSS